MKKQHSQSSAVPRNGTAENPGVRSVCHDRRNSAPHSFSSLLRKHPLLCIAGIAAMGFLIRLAVSIELFYADPAVTSPMKESDMATYIAAADAILHGKFPRLFYYQPFYYAVFLPLCRLFGAGSLVTAIIQALLGGAIIFLAGDIACRIGGRKAGIWTAFLASFSSILIYFTPYALLEILQAFWITLLLDLTLALLARPGVWKWGGTGLVLGCSILTRGNTWFLLPLLLTALFCCTGKTFSVKRKSCACALFIFGLLLPQVPFSLYNSIHDGRFRGPSTAGGAVLALGNNPEAAPAGLEIPYPPSYDEWMRKEKEISIPRRILDHALHEPGAWIELKCKQFFLFWSETDHSNNISEEYNAMKSGLMRTVRFLPTGVIVALALAGLFAGFHQRYFLRRKGFLLLAGFLFLYALSVTAFYILARFRLPVVPLLCAAGGIFLARSFSSRTWHNVVRMVLILLGGIFLCCGLYPLYAFGYEPALMRFLRPAGVQVYLEDPAFPGAAYQGWNLSVMDSSSMYQGGWNMIPVKENMEIVKDFYLPGRTVLPSEGGVVIPLVVERPETISIEINGERFSGKIMTAKFGVFSFGIKKIPLLPVPGKPDTVRLVIRFPQPSGAAVCFDSRRDYGRTLFDGRKTGSEFAVRLLLQEKKPCCPVKRNRKKF